MEVQSLSILPSSSVKSVREVCRILLENLVVYYNENDNGDDDCGE